MWSSGRVVDGKWSLLTVLRFRIHNFSTAGDVEAVQKRASGLRSRLLAHKDSRCFNTYLARYNHTDGQRRLSLVGEPDRSSRGPRRALPVDPGHRRVRSGPGSE